MRPGQGVERVDEAHRQYADRRVDLRSGFARRNPQTARRLNSLARQVKAVKRQTRNKQKMILDKHIVVVAGASRGIGRSIAVELARQGATVIGTATSESGAEGITAALKEAGGQG